MPFSIHPEIPIGCQTKRRRNLALKLLCLVTNGIYLAVVSFIPNAADPGDLMRNGSPQWILVAFGTIAFPLGLFLWNRLGVNFGLGQARGKVNGRVAIAVFVLLSCSFWSKP